MDFNLKSLFNGWCWVFLFVYSLKYKYFAIFLLLLLLRFCCREEVVQKVLKDRLTTWLSLQTVLKLVFVSKNTFLNSGSHLALHICFSVWVRTSHTCVYLLQESVFSSVDWMEEKVCGLGSLLLWVYPAFGSSIWMPLAQSKPCRANMFRLALSD